MNRSDNLDLLGAALATAQGEIKDAIRDSANPFFKSKYADLASVWEAARQPLSKNGLSVIQSVTSDDSHHWLETMLLHSSGQFVTDTIKLTLKDDTMQGLGSAITYARRYQLSAFVGVAPDDDDDGNQASGRKPNETPRQTVCEPSTAPKQEKPIEVDPDAQIKHYITEGFEIGLGITDPRAKTALLKEWGFTTWKDLEKIKARLDAEIAKKAAA